MADVLEMPKPMRRLPLDRHGRPVPWFVAWIDGAPDFRIVEPHRVRHGHHLKLCWVCGQPRGSNLAFLLGPMCGVTRTSSEPPSHVDCATYSARVCPFLANPAMRRRDRHRPEGYVEPAGTMITRNPGVALVWVTRSYEPFRVPEEYGGGVLFTVGEPMRAEWWAHGRPATRAEVLASIEDGMPTLRETAEAQGPHAVTRLTEEYARLEPLLPAEGVATR